MVFLKVSSANGVIGLYICLIFQPIMSSLMCFFHYIGSFPLFEKLMFDSSSNSSYMRSSFPNKFLHLKPSFFNLAFIPSLHVGLVKAVMRGNIIALFFNNLQNRFSRYSQNLCQLHCWFYQIYWDDSLHAIDQKKG